MRKSIRQSGGSFQEMIPRENRIGGPTAKLANGTPHLLPFINPPLSSNLGRPTEANGPLRRFDVSEYDIFPFYNRPRPDMTGS